MKNIYLTLAFILVGFISIAQKLPFQGYLEESGVPVNDTRTFIFELPDYGWTETIVGVPIDNGIYNVVLGEITLLPDTIFANVNETSLSITIDTTNIGTVTLYKPLINGTSLTKNGESIKIKNSTGKLRGELLPRDSDGQFRLFGANDSLKVFSGGSYGGRILLFDSLGSIGTQLRVSNKGLGNLYTYNESQTNVGWFGGYGNDGFTQLVSYDDTETLSGALLLGSFADGRYPEVYLEGAAQPNFGLARLKVNQLPNGEETAFLEINRSNGGGQVRLSIFQDDAGADPTGVSGSLDLFGDSSPNFIFGAAGWEDHDLANMSAYGSIGDGSGWYFSTIDMGISKTGDGTQEYGFLNFQNNQTGASNSTLSLMGNLNETGAGGIEVRDSLGQTTLVMDGNDGSVSLIRPGVGGSAINLYQFSNAGGISIQDASDNGRFFFSGADGNLILRDDMSTETVRIESQLGSIFLPGVQAGRFSGANGLIYATGENNTAGDNVRVGIEVIADGLGSSNGRLFVKNAATADVITLEGSTGTVTATTLTQASDRRYKKEITTLDNSLENTLKLRGTSYYWKNHNKSQKRQIGVIAQEVEEIYPEFVHTNDEGFKSVNYAQMTAVLIEAIKELNVKVDHLEKENEALTSALNETKVLSEKINKLEKLLLEDRKVASN